MKKEELAGLGIRLFAIAVFLLALSKVAGIAAYFLGKDDINEAIISGIIFIALVLISILLWLFPISIAKKILPIVSEQEINSPWTLNDLKEAGLVLIGIYILFYVLSDAIYWFVIVLVGNSYNDPITTFELQPDEIANIYTTGIEFIIACFLIFGSRGIVNFINYIRSLGTN